MTPHQLREHRDYEQFNRNFLKGKIPLKTPEEIIQAQTEILSRIYRNRPTSDFELDLRHLDCSKVDLSKYNPHDIAFDEGTIFPTDSAKMPKNFNPKEIMEMQKNPGLGIRQLHQLGLTGKGMSIAIIDTPLSDHQEYHDNLVYYEEFDFHENREIYENIRSNFYPHTPTYEENERTMGGSKGDMHGAAVASIAVDKTCGVAPDAKLYYFGVNGVEYKINNNQNGKIITERNSRCYAQAVERIIAINSELPKNERIQIVSISTGWMGVNGEDTDTTGAWQKAVQHAQQNGLVILDSGAFVDYPKKIHGLCKIYNGDHDKIESYPPASLNCYCWDYCRTNEDISKRLAFPMYHRTTASPTSYDGYTHYADGGWSWKTPYVAGLFLLARQIDKAITPEQFYNKALQTATVKENVGAIVNPIKLIDTLQNEQQILQQKTLEKTPYSM